MVKIESIIEAVLATVPAGDKLDPGVTIAKVRKRSSIRTNDYYASLVRWPKRGTKMVVAAANGATMKAACEHLAEHLGIKFEDPQDVSDADEDVCDDGDFQP